MKYWVDGFTIGSNPSKIGGGFTIFTEIGHLKTFNIRKSHFTSNEAELLGVLECCKLASEEDVIYTDSKNTIYWVKNGKSKARPDLNAECAGAKELVTSKRLLIQFIPRKYNQAGIYNEYHLNRPVYKSP